MNHMIRYNFTLLIIDYLLFSVLYIGLLMDKLAHEHNGLDSNGLYWTGLHLDMNIKPNLNSNIDVKWTKYGENMGN
jgi:hypothetical protein